MIKIKVLLDNGLKINFDAKEGKSYNHVRKNIRVSNYSYGFSIIDFNN